MKYILSLIIILSSVSIMAQNQEEKLNNEDKSCIMPVEDPQSADASEQEQQNRDQNSRREQIMNAKIAFFTTEIQLTPEEAQAFWPVYNKYWDEINKVHRETRGYLRELSKMDKAGKTDRAAISKLLNQYVESYEKEGTLYKEYYSQFLKVLSPEKVAKLYLAEERFRDRMIEMIKEQPKKE